MEINFKNHTRDEFIGFIEEIKYGDIVSLNHNNPIRRALCPDDINLKELDVCTDIKKCPNCWLSSIKDTKFRGEK